MVTLLGLDVDGTLLRGGVIGQRAAIAATRAVTDREPTDLPPRAGRTDLMIARDMLTAAGVAHDEVDDLTPAYFQALEVEAAGLMGTFRQDGRVLPGVRELLTAAAEHDQVVAAPLTGNIRAVARLKLAVFDLDGLLDFGAGAFGDDAADRAVLVDIARQRTTERTGRPVPCGRVVVIGDTPRDVDAARRAGARCVAVATGDYPPAELAAADLVLNTLTGPGVLDRILAVTHP
ncbi:haloacid dehalogenase-like hydrolase [Longispora sp. K20-0274]|uniref:HAD hydrolase-like protein n=1 Tax=Longispora sp. K20-0274 TaxID=3088255 RepID=UPI0039997AE2